MWLILITLMIMLRLTLLLIAYISHKNYAKEVRDVKLKYYVATTKWLNVFYSALFFSEILFFLVILEKTYETLLVVNNWADSIAARFTYVTYKYVFKRFESKLGDGK